MYWSINLIQFIFRVGFKSDKVMQQKNGASVCVCWRGGIMSQLPLCCKTTKDKQKRHITRSPSHVKHEEQGSGSGVLIFYYFQFFMISSIFVWVASSASYHAGPINGNLLFSSLTAALKLSRACTLCNFPALNTPADIHLTLTSAVQWTKCGLENEWQPLKQINYASTKLLAHVYRPGLALRAGHTPPYGMRKNGHGLGACRGTPLKFPQIFIFCLGHRRYTTYAVKCRRTSRMRCLNDCCWEITTAFWSICYPLTQLLKMKVSFCQILIPTGWQCDCCSK